MSAQADATAAETLKDAALTVREEARNHKRQARFHRLESQRLMGRFEELKTACEAIGVKFIDETGTDEGSQSHDHSSSH